MSFYKSCIRRQLFSMEPEKAHRLASRLLKVFAKIPLLPILTKDALMVTNRRLSQTLWGREFPNPVGLAAGMDKTGKTLLGWQTLGFGFLEVGGFSRLSQPGNPTPRLFRIPDAHALINRMGFNNPGADAAARTLAKIRPNLEVPLLVNIGKGKDTPLAEAAKEYADVLESVWDYVDGFVANVSSPNTLGLRNLQQKEFLSGIISAMQERAERLPLQHGEPRKPILIKISPDLTRGELDEVLAVIEAKQVDGIIASNTSTSRNWRREYTGAEESGGWSGPQLFPGVLHFVWRIREKLPSLPIIAVGGISNSTNVLEILQAGANLVQLYTALVYEGPFLIRRINHELTGHLRDLDADVGSYSPKTERQ